MSSITYTLRKVDLFEFNEHHAKMNTSYGRSLTRHRFIWPAVFVLIAVFLVSSTKDVLLGLFLITVAILWSTFVSMRIKKNFYKHLMGGISDDDASNVVGEYTLELTEDGLMETKPVGELKITWDSIVKLEKSKSHLYLYLTEDAAIIIPKETLVDKDSLKPFHKELVEALEKTSHA